MDQTLILVCVSGFALLAMGAIATYYSLKQKQQYQNKLSRRLAVDDKPASKNTADKSDEAKSSPNKASETVFQMATGGDKQKIARVRQLMIKAGEFDPSAVTRFVVSRFIGLFVGFASALLFIFTKEMSIFTQNGIAVLFTLSILGYFAPSIRLSRKIAARKLEYRNGFPDFMDLMIVCADAGLSLEASVDRVSRELQATYPALSQNLMTLSLELRAGRSIDEAMESLGQRINLDEVDAFAVLLKQSKELGTSLSGTLRVFSEEMRDKRMSKAEEKAHALPAKMTIPVTVCILPTVVLIAIIPIIVTLGNL